MSHDPRMQTDWDSRARESALQFIAGYGTDPRDLQSFYARGSELAELLLPPVFDRLNFEPRGARILDIGCGIGRFFPGFETLGFSEIWGLDVSQEMVIRGREACPVAAARWIVGTGSDLRGLEDRHFDYCFSYVVFQHLPSVTLVWQYLEEIRRVLAPGAVVQLHFQGRFLLSARLQKLKGRLLGIMPRRLRPAARVAYRVVSLRWLRGLPVLGETGPTVPGSPDTITGVAVSPADVCTRLEELGFTDLLVTDDPTHPDGTRFWVSGRKR